MKIVFLNSIGQIGGAERSLLDLMASLREQEKAWPLHLICGDYGPLTEACDSIGVTTSILPLPEALAGLGDAAAGGPAGRTVSKVALLAKLGARSLAAARYIRRLRYLLLALAPDALHTNSMKMHFLAAFAKSRRTPLLWHIHDYLSARVVMATLLRLCHTKCAAAIATSASVARDLRGTLGDQIAIHSVWNAVDLNEFAPEGPILDLDNLCGLPAANAGVVRVGLVGTFAKWKGQKIFLRALSLLPQGLPVRGYIVGGPLYRSDASQWRIEDLQKEISRLGLDGRVGLTGHIQRPAAAMRALDVIVHASTEPEPFGLVIAETMACRRAVIVSRAGGAAEIIQDGVDAVGYESGNALDLARLITNLAMNREGREMLGAAGRVTAERKFDLKRLACQVAPIYEAARRRGGLRTMTENARVTHL